MTTRTGAGSYDSCNVAVRRMRDLEAAHIPDADITLVARRSVAHDMAGASCWSQYEPGVA